MSARQYEVIMLGATRAKAAIIPIDTSNQGSSKSAEPAYTIAIPIFTHNKNAMSLFPGSSTEAIATADFHLFSGDIKLCLGPPDSPNSPRGTMLPTSTLGYGNIEFSLDEKTLVWKSTRKGKEGEKLWDWQHLKLVDKSSGDVLARFTHHVTGWSKRGVFEIEERGKEWDKIVCFTGMVALEYLRLWITARY